MQIIVVHDTHRRRPNSLAIFAANSFAAFPCLAGTPAATNKINKLGLPPQIEWTNNGLFRVAEGFDVAGGPPDLIL